MENLENIFIFFFFLRYFLTKLSINICATICHSIEVKYFQRKFLVFQIEKTEWKENHHSHECEENSVIGNSMGGKMILVTIFHISLMTDSTIPIEGSVYRLAEGTCPDANCHDYKSSTAQALEKRVGKEGGKSGWENPTVINV